MTKTSSFTSESVCAGHPDKICDQISDAVVDAVLRGDRYGKVAVETLVTENRIILAGEVSSKIKIDYTKIAQEQIKRLGYVDDDLKFNYNSPINVYIHEQSEEIAVGVRKKGAGDQGMMFGYACSETRDFMPMPISLAHGLVKQIDKVRESGIIEYLRPDGKSQVTVGYINGKPKTLNHIVFLLLQEYYDRHYNKRIYVLFNKNIDYFESCIMKYYVDKCDYVNYLKIKDTCKDIFNNFVEKDIRNIIEYEVRILNDKYNEYTKMKKMYEINPESINNDTRFIFDFMYQNDLLNLK